ncbi:stage II sporulation protein M [Ferviditalea candida]|uniref:stage II sporulation protein M n=1 Tax=Ferviditalea candida TaxID=3108399 RepID=UPI00352CEEC3
MKVDSSSHSSWPIFALRAVIFVAGGAGLYMGYRMFVPGCYPRKFQLLRSAKESAQLLLGTLPMFVVAGIIEGYITPAELPLQAKYGFAAVTLLLLIFYFLYASGKKLTRLPWT